MNFKHASRLLIAVVVVSMFLATQWQSAQRLGKLEQQLTQLRLELAQRPASPQPQTLAQQPVAPQAAPQAVASLTAAATQAPEAQPRQELRAKESAVPYVPASFGSLELTTAQPTTPRNQEPVRVASAVSHEQGVRELTEDELSEVVAGELGPGPGIPASATAPSATFPGGETAKALQDTSPQRLAPRVEKGGVLLRKGRTQIEPTISYTHISKNRVGLSGLSLFDVIFIGEIQANEVKRDLFTSSLNIRHGLTNTLQVEMELPAQMQREETLGGPIEARTQSLSHDYGFNDVSAGFFYQFLHESARVPAMIAHTRLKIPTGKSPQFGSGVWAVKSGLVMVKTSDPVAVFSNLGYTYTFPGQVNHIDINPGDSFDYNVGLSYALNYQLAASASFEQIFVGEARQRGSPVPGSRLSLANFKAGLTYTFTKQFAMDFSVGTGLTEDSPDLTVSLSFPYTF